MNLNPVIYSPSQLQAMSAVSELDAAIQRINAMVQKDVDFFDHIGDLCNLYKQLDAIINAAYEPQNQLLRSAVRATREEGKTNGE
jgi:hypothetical protein